MLDVEFLSGICGNRERQPPNRYRSVNDGVRTQTGTERSAVGGRRMQFYGMPKVTGRVTRPSVYYPGPVGAGALKSPVS
jgi:hypothetical protein